MEWRRPGCWFLSHVIHMKQCIHCKLWGKRCLRSSPDCMSTSSSWNKMQNGRVPKQENAYVMYELIIINCTKSSHRKVFFFLSGKISQVTWYQNYKAHLFNNNYKITENNKETYRKILTHFQKSLGKTKDQVLALASPLLHHLLHCLLHYMHQTLSNITVILQSSSRTFDNLKWTINTLVKWISQ